MRGSAFARLLIYDLKHFGHAEVAGGRIGRLIERDSLAERRLHGVIARRIGLFTFGRQSACGRLDRAGVKRVELFDVGDDLRNLRRESAAFFGRDFEVRKLRDLFDVGFCDWHDSNLSEDSD